MEASYSSRNPWSEDDRSLGAIKNILYLAEKTGHLAHSQKSDRFHNGGELQDETLIMPTKSPKCSSLEMIERLRNVEKLQKSYHQKDLEIHCRKLDKETKDITHHKVLEKRIEKLSALNNHVQAVVSQKDQLIHRLQQPYVGDCIKLQASCKQYASEVVPQLVPILSDLTSQLDNISWAASTKTLGTEMETVLSDISSLLASLQSSFHAMTKFRSTLQQLVDQRTADTEHSWSWQ